MDPNFKLLLTLSRKQISKLIVAMPLIMVSIKALRVKG
jgi:hypothetical protein